MAFNAHTGKIGVIDLFECILLMCINTNQFSAVKNQNLRKKVLNTYLLLNCKKC